MQCVSASRLPIDNFLSFKYFYMSTVFYQFPATLQNYRTQFSHSFIFGQFAGKLNNYVQVIKRKVNYFFDGL